MGVNNCKGYQECWKSENTNEISVINLSAINDDKIDDEVHQKELHHRPSYSNQKCNLKNTEHNVNPVKNSKVSFITENEGLVSHDQNTSFTSLNEFLNVEEVKDISKYKMKFGSNKATEYISNPNYSKINKSNFSNNNSLFLIPKQKLSANIFSPNRYSKDRIENVFENKKDRLSKDFGEIKKIFKLNSFKKAKIDSSTTINIQLKHSFKSWNSKILNNKFIYNQNSNIKLKTNVIPHKEEFVNKNYDTEEYARYFDSSFNSNILDTSTPNNLSNFNNNKNNKNNVLNSISKTNNKTNKLINSKLTDKDFKLIASSFVNQFPVFSISSFEYLKNTNCIYSLFSNTFILSSELKQDFIIVLLKGRISHYKNSILTHVFKPGDIFGSYNTNSEFELKSFVNNNINSFYYDLNSNEDNKEFDNKNFSYSNWSIYFSLDPIILNKLQEDFLKGNSINFPIENKSINEVENEQIKILFLQGKDLENLIKRIKCNPINKLSIIDQIPYIKYLPKENKIKIAKTLELSTYEKDNTLLSSNKNIYNKFYYVLSGKLVLKKSNSSSLYNIVNDFKNTSDSYYPVKNYSKGEYFNEDLFIKSEINDNQNFELYCVKGSIVLTTTKNKVKDIFEKYLIDSFTIKELNSNSLLKSPNKNTRIINSGKILYSNNNNNSNKLNKFNPASKLDNNKLSLNYSSKTNLPDKSNKIKVEKDISYNNSNTQLSYFKSTFQSTTNNNRHFTSLILSFLLIKSFEKNKELNNLLPFISRTIVSLFENKAKYTENDLSDTYRNSKILFDSSKSSNKICFTENSLNNFSYITSPNIKTFKLTNFDSSFFQIYENLSFMINKFSLVYYYPKSFDTKIIRNDQSILILLKGFVYSRNNYTGEITKYKELDVLGTSLNFYDEGICYWIEDEIVTLQSNIKELLQLNNLSNNYFDEENFKNENIFLDEKKLKQSFMKKLIESYPIFDCLSESSKEKILNMVEVNSLNLKCGEKLILKNKKSYLDGIYYFNKGAFYKKLNKNNEKFNNNNNNSKNKITKEVKLIKLKQGELIGVYNFFALNNEKNEELKHFLNSNNEVLAEELTSKEKLFFEKNSEIFYLSKKSSFSKLNQSNPNTSNNYNNKVSLLNNMNNDNRDINNNEFETNSSNQIIYLRLSNIALLTIFSDKMLRYYTEYLFNFCMFKTNSLLNTLTLERNLSSSTFTNDIKLIAELGQGAFGVCLLVKYLNKFYALKVVTHHHLISKPKLRKYFSQEMDNTINIISPFKNDIKALYYNNYSICYMLSYSSSLTLRALLKDFSDKKQLLPLVTVKEIVTNLLVCLDGIHRKSVIHRDVKPENIMIREDGYITLIDFGLSTKVKYFTNSVVGSPYYMSPEQIQGYPYSKSADYWSVGVILYEMLYGFNPFKRSDDCSTKEIYSRISSPEEVFFPMKRSRTNTKIEASQKIEDKDFNSFKFLCERLLSKDLQKRLTDIKGVMNIFSFDYNSIEDMHFQPKRPFSNEKKLMYIPSKYFRKSDVEKYVQFINSVDTKENNNLNNNLNNKNYDNYKVLENRSNSLSNREFLSTLDGVRYNDSLILSYLVSNLDKEIMLLNELEYSSSFKYSDWLHTLPLSYKSEEEI